MLLAVGADQYGEDQPARLPVAVIAGSIRPDRQSRTVAEWVCADPVLSLDFRLIDHAEAGPPPCGPAPAAFVLVRPEYNHFDPAPMWAESISPTAKARRSPKWRCTCLSNPAGNGGWPPAKTPLGLHAGEMLVEEAYQ
jgi:hypothetical protein